MNKYFRYTMMTGILAGFVFFYWNIFSQDLFTSARFLPLELCNLMSMVMFVAFATNRKEYLSMIMYPLILGPIAAFCAPFGLFQMGGEFRVYFFYYHIMLMVGGLYSLYISGFKTSWKQVVYAVVFMFGCSLLAAYVNTVTGGNYMFLREFVFTNFWKNYALLFAMTWVGLLTFHGVVHLVYRHKQRRDWVEKQREVKVVFHLEKLRKHS